MCFFFLDSLADWIALAQSVWFLLDIPFETNFFIQNFGFLKFSFAVYHLQTSFYPVTKVCLNRSGGSPVKDTRIFVAIIKIKKIPPKTIVTQLTVVWLNIRHMHSVHSIVLWFRSIQVLGLTSSWPLTWNKICRFYEAFMISSHSLHNIQWLFFLTPQDEVQ